MCGFISGYELGYLQRRITLRLVQHESYGMTECFSEQTIAQMLEILGPHTLDQISDWDSSSFGLPVWFPLVR